MQALFYIGLFGTFFFVVSSITVGISMSTMQDVLNQRAQVMQMFREVDFAINEVIHREAPSLPAYLQARGIDPGVENVLFTAGDVSWSQENLQIDPWRSSIEVIRIREMEPLGPGVQAEVSYYILASRGTDRQMQSELPEGAGLTYDDWRDFRSVGISEDDIVHTFSTKDAVTEIWNRASQVEQQIARTAVNTYQRNVEQFNRASGGDLEGFGTCAMFGVTDDNTLENINCGQFSSDLINECFEVYQYQQTGGEETEPQTNILPNAEVSVGECWKYEPGFRSNPAFPAMVGSVDLYNNPDSGAIIEELGVQVFVDNDPFTTEQFDPGGIITFAPGGEPHELILGRRDNDPPPGWRFDNRQTVIRP